eukprot:2248592-Rhodomonas_salina.4
MKPLHPENCLHAFERQKAKRDVGFVLSVYLDGCCRCVRDREQRTVGEADRGRRGQQYGS